MISNMKAFDLVVQELGIERLMLNPFLILCYQFFIKADAMRRVTQSMTQKLYVRIREL